MLVLLSFNADKNFNSSVTEVPLIYIPVHWFEERIISQDLQENTSTGVSFKLKLQACRNSRESVHTKNDATKRTINDAGLSKLIFPNYMVNYGNVEFNKKGLNYIVVQKILEAWYCIAN